MKPENAAFAAEMAVYCSLAVFNAAAVVTHFLGYPVLNHWAQIVALLSFAGMGALGATQTHRMWENRATLAALCIGALCVAIFMAVNGQRLPSQPPFLVAHGIVAIFAVIRAAQVWRKDRRQG